MLGELRPRNQKGNPVTGRYQANSFLPGRPAAVYLIQEGENRAVIHVHTNASDGQKSPAEVVALARELGLEALAITDHDTLGGIEPAVAAGQACGIEVIPGIELSTEDNGVEIHILGYLMELDHQELIDRISFFRRHRIERIDKWCLPGNWGPVEMEKCWLPGRFGRAPAPGRGDGGGDYTPSRRGF